VFLSRVRDLDLIDAIAKSKHSIPSRIKQLFIEF
jgi:hypothetical protein